MRRHDWTGFAALAAGVVATIELGRGGRSWAVVWLFVAAAAAILTRYWSIKYPAPMPHLLRWTLHVPRGNHSPDHLRRILEPQQGERILEVGPGVGLHAIPVASLLGPVGALDVVDVQEAMLADVARRAARAGIANVAPRQADARRLPYDDQTFDAAYLVGVLGEIPDWRAALRELRRVIKSNGRLVVGEVFFDPDFIPFGSLEDRARDAGFIFERRLGGNFSYLARFRPA
jgi:SAM-dependent methyltransferase